MARSLRRLFILGTLGLMATMVVPSSAGAAPQTFTKTNRNIEVTVTVPDAAIYAKTAANPQPPAINFTITVKNNGTNSASTHVTGLRLHLDPPAGKHEEAKDLNELGNVKYVNEDEGTNKGKDRFLLKGGASKPVVLTFGGKNTLGEWNIFVHLHTVQGDMTIGPIPMSVVNR